MNELLTLLRRQLSGELHQDAETKRHYWHDTSIFELHPDAVLFPKDAADIKTIVRFVSDNKAAYPSLGITPRGAGTDMSGAAIGSSLVLDMTKHMGHIRSIRKDIIHAQPGAFVRDIDPLLDEKQVMLASVPASRALCTIGGMVANNAGGEQSLRYGNTEHWVRQLSVVLADGKEYHIRPLHKKELDEKLKEKSFIGDIYREVYNLIEENYDLIHNARPKVSKNSMGYNLWSVWDRETGIFDLTRLFTGSQGTLGVITDIQMAPVPKAPHSGLLLTYVKSVKQLDRLVPLILKHKPATLEGFDDVTFNLGIKYFHIFRRQLGAKEWLKQQTALLGSVAKFKGHLPNVVLMVGFEADTYEAINASIAALYKDIRKEFPRMQLDVEGDEEASKPFWKIRRSSFALLRQKVHDKYAAPFIDDLTVQPKYLPDFLPKLRRIIRKYKIPATLAGHFGDGNFHILPLMDMSSGAERAKFEPAMREIAALIVTYKGTLAGEHNDGLVRGPWLPAIFGQDVYRIFRQTKLIFDPQGIFNPHKKTEATWNYSMDHVRKTNKS